MHPPGTAPIVPLAPAPPAPIPPPPARQPPAQDQNPAPVQVKAEEEEFFEMGKNFYENYQNF